MKFSIITPCYNGEKFIEKCINSVKNQTYFNYEHIIINDGSTDNSEAVIKKNMDNNNKIIYKSIKNGGVSNARNLAINISQGDWIIFLDCDDWIEKNFLKDINELVKKDEKIDCVITPLIKNETVMEKFNIDETVYVIENIQKKELLDNTIAIEYGNCLYNGKYKNSRCIGGKIYRKKLLTENHIDFDKNLRTFEDGVLNLYSIYYSRKIILLNSCYYHYFQNTASVTNNYISNCRLLVERIYQRVNFFAVESHIENLGLAINYLKYELLCTYIGNELNNLNLKNSLLFLNDIYLKLDVKKDILSNLNIMYLTNSKKIVYFLLSKKSKFNLCLLYKLKKIIKLRKKW